MPTLRIERTEEQIIEGRELLMFCKLPKCVTCEGDNERNVNMSEGTIFLTCSKCKRAPKECVCS